ncbi:helix-turn-helix domain-containing protein [uncultured Pontibacter sp.]|uniref:helix-turn-helix domain-containing protein n=1 Tax=uncultured Pontibacter sp. TaxID=453356 RepID=UPI00262977EF|nr:helix-turn-helix domain-containing protein [uncultured Pontibacter sp.]
MGVTLDQLLTVGDMREMLGPLFHELKKQREIAAKASDCMMTIAEAAEYVKHSRRTVTSWIKEGKPGRNGRKVKLRAYEYQPGNYRISKQDLDAFGLLGSE